MSVAGSHPVKSGQFTSEFPVLKVGNEDSNDSAEEPCSDRASGAGRDLRKVNAANKRGEYLLPNDETEKARLDIQHHLMLVALDGKLHIAPIEGAVGGRCSVLDICTGNGNWAISFANAYPSVNVIGVDISRMQPESTPSNCHFEIKDVEEEWKFLEPFDYIHGRALVSCFRSHKTVFDYAFKALRPGGYFELQDCILPLRFLESTGDGTELKIWAERFMTGAAALGKDFTIVEKYKTLLAEIGFIDIFEVQGQLPVGPWAAGRKMKALGSWMRKDLLHGIEGMTMAVQTRGLGLSPEDVKSHLTDVKKEILSDKVHAYFQMSLVYGRKPSEDDTT